MSKKSSQLQTSQKSLVPVAFYIRELKVHCSDTFDPYQADMTELEFQFLRDLVSLDEAEFVPEDNSDQTTDPDSRMYLFRHILGVRAINSCDSEKAKKVEASGENIKEKGLVQFGIRAVYESRYFCHAKVDREAIQIFGEKNVPFNLWPFWREYVHDTCSRMGFRQPAILPLLQPLIEK